MTTDNLDWTDPELLKALGKALIRGGSTKKMAEEMAGKFPGRNITRNVVLGALQRDHVIKHLKKIFPETQITVALRAMELRNTSAKPPAVPLRQF